MIEKTSKLITTTTLELKIDGRIVNTVNVEFSPEEIEKIQELRRFFDDSFSR